MVLGIGVDSIEITRVKNAVQGNPLLVKRLFTPREIEQLPAGSKAYFRMAALFAGKEAVFKALGTGLTGHTWQQVEILHLESGAPQISLHGEAKHTARCREIERVHISLSHDKERALAFCVAEGIK